MGVGARDWDADMGRKGGGGEGGARDGKQKLQGGRGSQEEQPLF